jgi:hypothetical protein
MTIHRQSHRSPSTVGKSRFAHLANEGPGMAEWREKWRRKDEEALRAKLASTHGVPRGVKLRTGHVVSASDASVIEHSIAAARHGLPELFPSVPAGSEVSRGEHPEIAARAAATAKLERMKPAANRLAARILATARRLNHTF